MVANDENHENLSVEFVGDQILVSNSSFHFSGACCKSENGKYILAWKENLQVFGNDEGDSESVDETNYDDELLTEKEEELYARYLEKEFKEGFLLLEDQKLILKALLPRPAYGKVANNGSFIFNSGIDRSNELKGRFIAYNKKGEELVNYKFSTNLGINSLSNNGKYAICQTLFSNTEDSHVVACFDLANKKLLWKKVPETKIADAIKFDSEEENIIFIYNNTGYFRYSLTGELLDKTQWYKARIKHSSGFELIEIADQKLATMGNTINPLIIDEVLDLYLMATERIDSNYFLAKAHRKIGEIYELIGKIDKTIFHFEQAQKHDPKIGIKKKLQKMKLENKKSEI